MLGKCRKYSPQWWFDGDLPHGPIRKTSPTKQIQVDSTSDLINVQTKMNPKIYTRVSMEVSNDR